jgi:S-formylglutathione hydrolase FrmB
MPHSFPASDRVETRDVAGVPVSILLPPRYRHEGNVTRYPVLYILHGGFTWYGAWLSMTDIEAFTASLPEEQQAIVVMPDGGWGAHMDFNPGPSTWERFETESLIDAIDSSYRTIASRSHRAIAGESGGGFGALAEASRHPDLYVAVVAFEPAITDGMSPVALAIAAFTQAYYRICPDGPGESQMRPPPDPITGEVWYRNASPVDLVSNLDGMSIYSASGTGVPCDSQDLGTLANVYPTFVLETRDQVTRFIAAAEASGVAYTAELPACGLHTYRYFMGDLRRFWPQMVAAFGESEPTSFDFQSADATRSVWSWTFEADPARAPEFLDVIDATANRVTLTGSGIETLTTPPYFSPGETVTLTNAVEPTAVADPDGRITFHVDLGPAHKLQQYSPRQRIAELTAGGTYWTTRTVIWSTP